MRHWGPSRTKLMLVLPGALVLSLAVTLSTALANKAGQPGQKGERPVTEECMRCHDVQGYQKELAASVHAVDKDKKTINCDQCHQFHFNPVTNYYARDAYYDKKIFQPEDFNRRRLQKNARATIQADKCLACHKDLYKNAKGEAISEIGKLCHEAFEGKNGSTRQTCAGCHINIAHLPDFDRDLMVNAEYVKRLAAKEGKK